MKRLEQRLDADEEQIRGLETALMDEMGEVDRLKTDFQELLARVNDIAAKVDEREPKD